MGVLFALESAGPGCARGQAMGPLLTDASLAAIAMENAATLVSTDRDFARFSGLKWVNPLDAQR